MPSLYVVCDHRCQGASERARRERVRTGGSGERKRENGRAAVHTGTTTRGALEGARGERATCAGVLLQDDVAPPALSPLTGPHSAAHLRASCTSESARAMEPAERAAAGAAAALDSDSDGETNRSAPVVNDATADLIAGWLGGAGELLRCVAPTDLARALPSCRRRRRRRADPPLPSSQWASSSAIPSRCAPSARLGNLTRAPADPCTRPNAQVLKVRLQTAPSSTATPSTSSPRVGKSSVSPLRSPSFPFPPPPTPLGRSAAPAPLPVAASPAQHSPSTLRTPGPTSLGASPSATPQPAAASAPHAPSTGQAAAARPGLISLYRSEGIRFFFAGTAGPILGLAFIDSAFFGLYGRMM